MKHLSHTLTRALPLAAALWLLAAGGVSCGNGTNNDTIGSAQNNSPQPLLPPDTLALVEGLRLFEEAEYDLAREQLTVSALSTSTYIRAESQLYLNALETELGNYEVAREHLDRYHTETRRMLLLTADSSRRMEQEAARLRRRQDVIDGGMVVLALLVAGVVVFLMRRRRMQAVSGSASGLASGSVLGPEAAPDLDISDWRRYLDDAEAFKCTEIWEEIAALAVQKPSRDARVLSLARQEVSDGELALGFSEFAARLRADYPALTAGDVKLCCLSLLPLSTFARALCFGSVETGIIKQRKHTIKKKLGTSGSALFEFIFEARG